MVVQPVFCCFASEQYRSVLSTEMLWCTANIILSFSGKSLWNDSIESVVVVVALNAGHIYVSQCFQIGFYISATFVCKTWHCYFLPFQFISFFSKMKNCYFLSLFYPSKNKEWKVIALSKLLFPSILLAISFYFFF